MLTLQEESEGYDNITYSTEGGGITRIFSVSSEKEEERCNTSWKSGGAGDPALTSARGAVAMRW